MNGADCRSRTGDLLITSHRLGLGESTSNAAQLYEQYFEIQY
ncbi:hypothetical protein ND16A_1901 [Thalassotalea sp. ND16A]|nr:hypothetical protein ND16A_1901 [Thalassotalea sp. ND16A]